MGKQIIEYKLKPKGVKEIEKKVKRAEKLLNQFKNLLAEIESSEISITVKNKN